MCSHIFIIHNDHTYITGDYTKLCLNIICNRSFFLFWNDVSFVPVRVLHKDEKILGRKHIYLPHAQTAIYDSKVKLFLKQGIISYQLGRDAVVRFECENSAIDVIINFLWKTWYSTGLSTIILVVLTTANFGGFSNFCRYYTRSRAGKSTGPLWNPCKMRFNQVNTPLHSYPSLCKFHNFLLNPLFRHFW